MPTEYQLRQYVINEGRWDELISVFPDIARARLHAGFGIVGVWTVEAENKFIWIVSTDHPGGIEGATVDYYESEERKAIPLDVEKVFAEIETVTMSALPGF